MKEHQDKIISGVVASILTLIIGFIFVSNTMSFEKTAEKFVSKEVYKTCTEQIKNDVNDIKSDVKDMRAELKYYFRGNRDGSK